MKKQPLYLFVVLASVLFFNGALVGAATASNFVNIQNGNFFYPATDLYLPCFDLPLEVGRVYNHFYARRPSPFGLGWNFNYDVKLVVSDFDTPQALEADGYQNDYYPKGDQPSAAATYVIDRIVQKRQEQDRTGKGKAVTADAYDKYREKMQSDPEYLTLQRSLYFPKKGTGGELPLGHYLSLSRGGSTLEVTADGAIRIFPGGRSEQFDRRGRLLKIADNKGNYLTFTYADERLQKVSDSCGRFFIFTYQGPAIASVKDSLGRSASYSYRDGKMLEATNASGEKTSLQYDREGRLNSIIWQSAEPLPKTEQIAVQYYSTADRVKEVAGPGRTQNKFRYGKDKNYFWRERISSAGIRKFLFYPQERRQVEQDEKGGKTITVLSACCGKPERVTDPRGRISLFQYDPQTGNLLKQVEPTGNVITYQYDPRYQYIAQVDNAQQGVTRFVYDDKGNITFARFLGRKGQKGEIKIAYGARGKIRSIQQGDEEISFENNFFGKPTTVTMKKGNKVSGVLNTFYTPSGAVEKSVFRPNTPELQQLLMGKLQQYMQILQPTGLNVG